MAVLVENLYLDENTVDQHKEMIRPERNSLQSIQKGHKSLSDIEVVDYTQRTNNTAIL